jgi:hypothetical protein
VIAAFESTAAGDLPERQGNIAVWAAVEQSARLAIGPKQHERDAQHRAVNRIAPELA